MDCLPAAALLPRQVHYEDGDSEDLTPCEARVIINEEGLTELQQVELRLCCQKYLQMTSRRRGDLAKCKSRLTVMATPAVEVKGNGANVSTGGKKRTAASDTPRHPRSNREHLSKQLSPPPGPTPKLKKPKEGLVGEATAPSKAYKLRPGYGEEAATPRAPSQLPSRVTDAYELPGRVTDAYELPGGVSDAYEFDLFESEASVGSSASPPPEAARPRKRTKASRERDTSPSSLRLTNS